MPLEQPTNVIACAKSSVDTSRSLVSCHCSSTKLADMTQIDGLPSSVSQTARWPVGFSLQTFISVSQSDGPPPVVSPWLEARPAQLPHGPPPTPSTRAPPQPLPQGPKGQVSNDATEQKSSGTKWKCSQYGTSFLMQLGLVANASELRVSHSTLQLRPP